MDFGNFPLGCIALLFGFVAKEIVIGALGVLYGLGEDAEEADISDSVEADPKIFALNSLGLMVFTLLYMPCVATVGIIKKETGSWKWMLFAIAYGIILAWTAAFLIFQVGSGLGYD